MIRVLVLLLTLATGVAPLARAETRLYPGVASVVGLNGTRWKSSARVRNPTAEIQAVLLRLRPRGSATVVSERQLDLQPGATQVLEDLYAELAAADGAGTLEVEGRVQAWVTTANDDPSGHYGLAIPGTGAEEAFPAGEEWLLVVVRSADAATGPRSNLVLANPGASPITVTFETGTAGRSVTVPPSSHVQVTDVGAALGLGEGRHLLRATGDGPWFGYAVTVDPVSGDPWPQPALPADGGEPAILFAGVASEGGLSGTEWRSELLLANPTGEEQEVVLILIPRGESFPSAIWEGSLAPGEVLEAPDLYDLLDAAPGHGALVVAGMVKAWVRTFNDDPPRTFGGDLPGVGLYDLLEPGAEIAFPLSRPEAPTSGPRSNLVLVNVWEGELEVGLRLGASLETVTVPPGTHILMTDVGTRLGSPVGKSVLLASSTTPWYGFVSTVDPVSGDPWTVLPARPLRPLEAASAHASLADRGTHLEVVLDYSDGASPATVGAELGQLIGQVLPNYGALVDHMLAERLGDEASYPVALARAAANWPQVPAPYREELEGLAAGLGLSNDDRFRDGALSLHELQLLSLAGDVVGDGRCSAVAVFGQRSATGASLTARLVDEAGAVLPDLQSVTLVATDSDGLVVNVGFLGFLGIATGFNQAGLLVGDLTSDTGTPFPDPPTGLRSSAYDMRWLLEHETTVDGGAAFLARPDHGYPGSLAFILSDPLEAAVLENDLISGGPLARTLRRPTSPLNPGVEWGLEDAVAAVNSFVLEGNLDNHTNVAVNEERWASLRAGLVASGDTVTLEELEGIATSHVNPGLYPHHPGDVYNFGTQQVVVFDPMSGILNVAFHPRTEWHHADPQFVRFTLDDLGRMAARVRAAHH
jgi:hypothetical protein